MALIVKTNTYVDEATAAAYLALVGLDALATPEQSLIRATIALDRLYGGRFIGTKATLEQPLMWPRNPTSSEFYTTGDWFYADSFGNYRNFSGIPAEIEQATAELAVMLEAGVDVYAQREPTVTEETVEVDVLKKSRKFAGGGFTSNSTFNKLDTILAPLLKQGGAIKLVR